MFKTRWDTFWNDFGHFWNFETFLIFLKIFEDSTHHGTLGKKFIRKNHLKTSSKHNWTLLGMILGIFGILNFFWFFWKFSKTRPSMEHWAKIFFKKITLKHLQNTFGHFWERFWASLDFWFFFVFEKFRLDTFGDDFGHFWNIETFLIFLKIFEDSTHHGTLGKKFFRKNHLKTSSKHVWTLLGMILGIFGFLKFFWFFWNFSETRPSMEHCTKNFFEKITPKLVQNTFGHFWEWFRAFLEFGNFFDFFENFRRLDPPWNTGQKFSSKKSPQNIFKTRLDTFGNDLGHVWIFENFLIFLKIFEDSTLHGTLDKKFFRKNHPEQLQNTFGHFLERFRAFLEFWNFFDFFESFRRLDPPWNTGQKVLSKKSPWTTSKHVWTLLGMILDIFGLLKFFWLFWKFSKTRPSMEHWAKNFFKKNHPKHLQNTFGHFWEWFWAFLEFWNFFDFFENFRRLDPPWNTGQKFSSKKSPQNIFKTRLDTFGNDLGHVWIFENFLIFLKIIEDSTLHGTLDKKFFRKNHP